MTSTNGSWHMLMFSRLSFNVLLCAVAFFLFSSIGNAAVKWFPGHYMQQEPDNYSTNSKAFQILRGSDGNLFQGFFMDGLTWGQIETDKGVYRWDKIDTLLAGLPTGKKAGFSISWQAWNQPNTIPCPSDMVGNPVYDGGYRKKSNGTPFSTIHMPSTMTRYLDFVKQFAERYDANEKIALITSAEIPYEQVLMVKPPDGQYDATVARSNFFRLTDIIEYFPNTPCGILGAWWSWGGGDAALSNFTDGILKAGGGFGAPDLSVPAKAQLTMLDPYFINNAGKWANWMGVEWKDYISPDAGPPFPGSQLGVAISYKCNFIWWHQSGQPTIGYGFDRDVLPYLRAHPMAGITTDVPANISTAKDSDNDGMSDVDEAVAGTDPTNRLSVLRLTDGGWRMPDGGFVIRWQSASDHWYTVQTATNLLTGFNPIPGASNIPATYPVNVYTDDTANVGMKFYRVKVDPVE